MAGQANAPVQPPRGSDRLRDAHNASAANHQAASVQTDQVSLARDGEQSARVVSSGISQYIRTDIGAFLLTSGVLAIFDSIRDETKALLDKGESWRLSMLKHSTPLSADYFFKNDNAADRVTFLGVIINLLLSAGKFGVGVACHSSALIADAGHSLSDLFSDFVTLVSARISVHLHLAKPFTQAFSPISPLFQWAVQVARLPPDDDHPYGHGKFESVGSLFLSLTLLGTGLSVGLSSYIKFLTVISTQRTLGVAAAAKLVEVPTWPALVMASLSILSKEWLYRITRRVGENLNSQVVIANAWHHRSDAYSSVLALVSIGLAMTVPSFLASDSAAGILVAGMIALTGAEILGESIRQLTDAVIDEDMVEQIKIKSAEDADVMKVTKARARQVGSSALVDIEVEVPAQLSSSAMRAIEERIRVRIKSEVDGNILGVEVKAVAQDEVFCPLLTAVVESDADLNTSAVEVEEQARGILDSHPGVSSANKVTIHYVDTVMVKVDANICMDRSINTLKDANELAVILRDKLLDSDKSIVEANIFLDLNEMSGQEKVKVLQQ